MTPDPKLPPLREALERIAWRETPIHPRGPDDFTVYLPRHAVLAVAAPYAARLAALEKVADCALAAVALPLAMREALDDLRRALAAVPEIPENPT